MAAKVGLVLAVGALTLAGCHRIVGGEAAHQGRYLGVGVYPAGAMWSQIVVSAPADPKVAGLKDDEQVIVVVDSRTGEVRQCGALSGYCIRLDPWARQAAQASPVVVVKHADEASSIITMPAKAKSDATAP